MTVKAEYRGMTYEFPDGTPDDVIYQQIQQKFEEGNKDYGAQPEPAWYEGFSKIPEAIGEGWSSMMDATMAANVGPAYQEEALRQYELQEGRSSALDEQMGVVPQLVTGVGRYGPAVVAGMANPLLGGVVGGSMSSTDALREQYRTNKEFDRDRALIAGGLTGVTDVATGGLGRFIAKPGASLLSRTAQQAKTIAAEDMTSAAASKVYENWAANKDLTEDVGTAALMGGVAGGAVRGGLHAGSKGVEAAKNRFSGAARDMNIQPNAGSQASVKDVTDLEMGPGPSPSEQYADNYINYSTVARNAREDVYNAIDDSDLDSRIQGLNKVLEDGAHLDATARFGKALQREDAHIIDSMFDANIEMADGNVWNIGRDGLGLTEEGMLKSREDLINARGHNIPFKSRVGEAKEGLTAPAFNEKSQKFGRDIRKKMQGNMDKNLTFMKENLRLAKMDGSGASAKEKALWKEAVDSYTALHDAAVSYNKESDGTDTSYTAKVMSNRFNDAITRLGRADEILDVNGSRGNLNPLADFQAFTAITEGFRAQNKQFSQGKPDSLKEVRDTAVNIGYGLGTIGAGLINPALGAAVAAKKVADEAMKLRGRHVAGGRVKEAKARVKDLTPEVQMKTSLEGGDGPGAAAAAAMDLEAQGIKVPEQPITPEPVVEAPVITPEPVAPVMKPDAKVKTAPAPKAVQEVVEEVVESPKPEAKAPKVPQKTKEAIRKEKAAQRKAEREKRQQEKKAQIAADLQAQLKAESKQPLGRVSPARAEKEVVEEALPTPEPEAPVIKPDAKGRVKPEQKKPEEIIPEEVAQEVPAEVVEPKAKPDAKGRTKPEQKKLEETPEPTPEAPVSEPKQPLGRQAPERKAKVEEPSEGVTEAPVKDAEVEAPKAEEPKKVPAAKLVREPLKKIAEEAWPVGRRKEDTKGYRAHLKAKEDLKTIDTMMRTHDKYTPEEIAQAIEDTGGAVEFLKEANKVGKTPDTFLGLRMRELERLRQAEVKAKTGEMREILKNQATTELPKATDAEAKVDRVKADRKEFDDEMKALAIHPDDVAQVSKSIEGGMSLRNARKEATRLNNERKARMKKEIAAEERNLKKANDILDNQGKKAQVDEYISGLKVEGDNTIQAMVDDVFKHNTSTVTPKEVQNLLNKIDHYLAKQKEEYNNLSRAGGKADPRYPEWQAKAAAYKGAQSVLKSNRRKVDRVYSQADASAQEAAQELSKRERDYDALFREANQRDANILKVRNQKDELFEKLTGMGFGEMDVRKYIGSTFFERNSTPLTELGKKHTIEKFIEQQAKARNDSIAKKQKAVKAVIAETENGPLMEMARSLTDDVEFDTNLNSADDLLAMTRALAEEVKSRGMTKEADRLEAFNTGLLEGKLNKTKYPNNPELWVPYEVKKKIQDSFGEGTGSAYAGNLWMNIKAAVAGNTKDDGKFGTLTRKELEARASKLEGKVGGKLLTGDDDIIVK